MEKGRLMLRSLLVAAAVLLASIPVAAQQQLWSATMTTGENRVRAIRSRGAEGMMCCMACGEDQGGLSGEGRT